MCTRKSTFRDYSSNNGLYQLEYNRLFNQFVPSVGEAETLKGELIRCISLIGYEYHNNGNCNAVSDNDNTSFCNNCGGDGEEVVICSNCYGDGECEECNNLGEIHQTCTECYGCTEIAFLENATINPYYNSLLLFIENNVPNIRTSIEKIKTIISTKYPKLSEKFSDDNEKAYNDLFDAVIFYARTIPNNKLK